MKQSAKHFFSTYFSPTFHGMTLRKWSILLRNNKIDFPYHFRLLPTTFKSLVNTFLAAIEKKKFEEQYKHIKIEPPIFILGHWRSGTTMLQNIFARDTRFAFPNLYQVTNPYTFLLSEETFITRLFSLLVPDNRLFDNVPFGLKSPHEDEFIAWHGSGLSPCLFWNFPKQSGKYDKYLSLKDCNHGEIENWRNEFLTFYKKLTFKYKKPLVLKSPTHTARLAELLSMFPQAKFIHIYRNPYRVYQSTKKLNAFILKISSFQRFNPDKIHRRIINQYMEMHDIYFEEKRVIPSENLIEVQFEAFEKNPLKTLEAVYKKLNLPDFNVIK
ncbi:MAG: sulfotransferase, partial [Calditrichaceae bacterium]